MVGILDRDVLDVVDTLDRGVLAVRGTFQAAQGKEQKAGSRELQGRVQAVVDRYMESNCRLEGVRKAVHPELEDLK